MKVGVILDTRGAGELVRRVVTTLYASNLAYATLPFRNFYELIGVVGYAVTVTRITARIGSPILIRLAVMTGNGLDSCTLAFASILV